MHKFDSMTVAAACRLLESLHTVATLDSQIAEWGVHNYVHGESKPKKLSSLAKFAIDTNPEVPTEIGRVPLDRAIILAVLEALGERQRAGGDWRKLVAGLRRDGFEVAEEKINTGKSPLFGKPTAEVKLRLRRMLPEDVPDLNFHEAENELFSLLTKHGFTDAKGHLDQAVSAFSRGDWAASNAQIRTFFEDLLSQISDQLGGDSKVSSAEKMKYLSSIDSGPFFLAEYNEWANERGGASYVQGLWSRLHPEGSHPGLSEEDDCAFRLQTVLITARLFMRRFNRIERRDHE